METDKISVKELMITHLERLIAKKCLHHINLDHLKDSWILDVGNDEDTTAAVINACRAENVYPSWDDVRNYIEQARVVALEDI